MTESTVMAWGTHNGPQSLALPLMALALLIGFSRVYVGKHYPSDVAGAILVAVASESIVGRIPPLSTDGPKGERCRCPRPGSSEE